MTVFSEAQTELYAKLQAITDAPFFLKTDRNDSGMWITDLPRRAPHADLSCLLPEYQAFPQESGLLSIRFSQSQWIEQINSCPQIMPEFPESDELLPVYALARLLLLHSRESDPVEYDRLAPVYRMTSMTPDQASRRAEKLLREYAEDLRRGRVLPHPAGWFLAEYLNRQVIR